MTYPYTNTEFDGLQGGPTQSGLSTQIIIKIGTTPVGALQELSVTQNRPLDRLKEIGTDGVIEIVPNGATTYDITARRLVFDNLRLPEAFSRNFRFIAAQRVPFDIEIIDTSNIDTPNTYSDDATGLVAMTYKNCWFQQYGTPYASENYTITETATIWAETAYVSGGTTLVTERTVATETDDQNIESLVNKGDRRGSFDASGLLNSITPNTTAETD